MNNDGLINTVTKNLGPTASLKRLNIAGDSLLNPQYPHQSDSLVDVPIGGINFAIDTFFTVIPYNTYYEVERKYELLQRKAKALGYLDGEEIPEELLYTPINPQKK
mgnify:CR=1 FL=1